MVEIARELKNAGINNTILIADALHQNFYEDSARPDTVKKKRCGMPTLTNSKA